jgi:hypothetical protein
MKIGGIYLEIRAKRDQLKKDLAVAKTDVERTAIKMEHAFAGALKHGIAGAGIAVVGFGAAFANAIKQGIQSTADLERRMLRTEAIIKATGNAAGFTSKQFLAMANRLDLATLLDRNSILDAINAMQTFREVSGDTFTRAIELSADLAEDLGTDLRSQVIQLGKALNDPITGLNSLNRSGVQFTNQQKEMIKTLINSNKMLEAQGIILDEIAKQVGGSAKSAAGGLSGSIDTLGKRWQDFTEILADFTNAGRTAKTVIDSLAGAIFNLGEHLRDPTTQEQIKKRINQLQTILNVGTNPNINMNQVQAQIEQLRQLLFREMDMARGLPPGSPASRGLRDSDFFIGDPKPAPAKLNRLEYPTELGITGAEAGYMASAQMASQSADFVRQAKAEYEGLMVGATDSFMGMADANARANEMMKEHTETTFSRMSELSERTAERMQDNFSNLFFDAMTGELKTFKDYMKAIFDSITRAWADMLGQMATQKLFGADFKGGGLLSSLPSLFGLGGGTSPNIGATGTTAMFMHGGGIVGSDGAARMVNPMLFAGAPRLHSGLSADEYPAILQRGEAVIPRGGGGTTYNITNNITALDAQSFEQRFRGQITGFIADDLNSNKALRGVVKKAAR